jgi:predicted transposase YdaD
MKIAEHWEQKGRNIGLQEGLQEGLQQGRQKGRQEGLQQGRQKGRQEGRSERDSEIARAMLAMGLDLATVELATGLSGQELDALAKKARSFVQPD